MCPISKRPIFAAWSKKSRRASNRLRSPVAACGAFPNARDPRTLWIGIEDGAEELKRLQAAIDGALKSRLGYAKEQRGFHPHLTIGRVKRELPGGQGELAELLQKHAHFDADLAVIDEVVTFASFLNRSHGPTHDALGRAELGVRQRNP